MFSYKYKDSIRIQVRFVNYSIGNFALDSTFFSEFLPSVGLFSPAAHGRGHLIFNPGHWPGFS